MTPTISSRDEKIDFLKGLALLGILLINIRGFSTYSISMINPALAGKGIHHELWRAISVLAQTKSLNLFSLLMGYSIYASYSRASSDRLLRVVRRAVALIALGLVHMFVFWQGDVLALYGLTALLAFPLLGQKSEALLGLGLLIYLTAVGWSISRSPQDLAALHSLWTPPLQVLASEQRIFLAPFQDYFTWRLPYVWRMQVHVYPTLMLPQCLGMVLIGCGLRKSEQEKPFFYMVLQKWRWQVFVLGAALCVFGSAMNEWNQWSADYSLRWGFQWNYVGSLLVACGLFSIVHSWKKLPWKSCVWISRAGRISLTNYILQSIVCGTLFYGWGFGLFAQLSFLQVMGTAISLWLLQVAMSVGWTNSFQSGPLENGVRIVTDWRLKRPW